MRAQIAIGTYRIEGYYNECPCRLLCNPEEIRGKKLFKIILHQNSSRNRRSIRCTWPEALRMVVNFKHGREKWTDL